MPRLPILLCTILLLVCAACSWSARTGDTGPTEMATEQVVSEYSDASLALADGTKFLDTGETDKAVDALGRAVKLDPNLAEAWFKLGIAYALAEKRDETLEMVRDNENSSGKKPAKTNSEKAFEKAVAAYKKVVDANEKDDVAYFNLGRAYNKLNEDADSAKALKQAVKLKADDTEYQTELGAILIKLAQYHEAIPPLKKALELDPENIRAQELLEDAQAGRSRINYSSTPKEDKRKAGDSNTSSTTGSRPENGKVPPPTPDAAKGSPRPSLSRPSKP